jgi:hypothetical protein
MLLTLTDKYDCVRADPVRSTKLVSQQYPNVLWLPHRNGHDLDVCALGHDRDRLLVSARVNGQVGREYACIDSCMDMAASDTARDLPTHIPGRLTPGAGQQTCSALDTAGDLEAIAVTGASELLSEGVSATTNRVCRSTPDSLARAVVQIDFSATGPQSIHAGKRGRLSVCDLGKPDHKHSSRNGANEEFCRS